ncbi:hypothetical protein [Synechococcus phage S-B43]|jgi:hypothetical protein|nr:hypothetical protein [Synechococcus phage S-H68]QCW23039.1 hypothetical protein [Synechococcus phage S-B05]QDH50726.1 hypothetical protein [Synechococcus phage S-B43]
MIGLYLTVTIVVLLVAYAGFDNTMKLFAYIDLQLRFIPLRIKMELMKRKLEKQLLIDREELFKKVEENAKDH